MFNGYEGILFEKSNIYRLCAGVHAKLLHSCPTLCGPMDCSLPGSSAHGILQARMLVWVAMPSSRGSSQPRDLTQVFCIAAQIFSELPGKPKNTGVGNLSLLQEIFLTWESNWGLLHSRQILYQLSYKGSPQSRCSTLTFKISSLGRDRGQGPFSW